MPDEPRIGRISSHRNYVSTGDVQHANSMYTADFNLTNYFLVPPCMKTFNCINLKLAWDGLHPRRNKQV